MAYLATAGCSARVVARDGRSVVIEVGSCLYPEVAREHPGVVCELSSACSAVCWASTRPPTVTHGLS